MGSRQTDAAPALRPYDASEQCPGRMRWVESGRCLCAAQRNFHLASLHIGSVKSGITFPEECCLSSIVAGSKWCLILPHTPNSKMILKVLPYTGKMLHNRYPQSLKFSLITNARQHQHLWRVNRPQGQNNFESSIEALDLAVELDLHAGGSRLV